MTVTVREPSRTSLAVPRWADLAARLAALTPVPASLWRLPLVFGASMGLSDMAGLMDQPLWARFCYLVGLGAASDGLAFLTLGLVRPWGEVWPRFLPVIGGRRVPPRVAIGLATTGGVAATVLWTYSTVLFATGRLVHISGGWVLLMTACYAPLLLWGPLVLAVTWHYYRRRCT